MAYFIAYVLNLISTISTIYFPCQARNHDLTKYKF